MIAHAPMAGSELVKLAALAGYVGDTLPGDRIEQHENLRWASKAAGPAWGDVGGEYIRTAMRVGYYKASVKLREHQPLVRGDLYLAADDADIRSFCDRRAKECARVLAVAMGNSANLRAPLIDPVIEGLRECMPVLDRYGLAWPAPSSPITGPGADLMPLVRRLCCHIWWRRQVRRLQAREVDQLARQRERVAKYRECYCSDFVVQNRRAAQRRNLETLSQTVAVNDAGQEYTLAELSELGVSNLENRRAELMTRISGFEKVAEERGHVGEFWTFTTASRWHRMRLLEKVRKAVPVRRWNGSTPRQVQDWLCILWARIRADLDRLGIRIYGFRVVEPHHDGTPHWHLLVFMREADRRAARKVCRKHLLSDDGNERGARQARFLAKAMDPAKGGASSYIAKYIAKNIDGRGVRGALQLQDDDSGLAMDVAAERARAWASAWGIRQFQQIGGPSVTVWRELRRLMSECEPGTDDLFGNVAVEAAGEAADCGDWAAFVEYMGGPCLPRCERPALPAYWIENTPIGTPGRDVTRYGDDAKGAVFGVWVRRCEVVDGEFYGPVLTRFYRWEIEHRPPARQALPDGPGVDALLGAGLVSDMSGQRLMALVDRIFGNGAQHRDRNAAPSGGALELCQ